MRRDSLLAPLAFAALVLGSGTFARLLVDSEAATSSEGTPGKLIWLLTPALLAVLMRRLDPATRGERYFALTRRSLTFALQVAIMAGSAICAVMVLGLVTGNATASGAGASASALALSAASIALFALLEESAWRGYLLPALLARVSYPLAVGIAALTWFGWHLPYLDQLAADYTSEPLATLAPRLLLGVFAMQWLYSELFLRCRSVWPAFALHATANIVAITSMHCGWRLVGSRAWLFSPSADGVIVIALCLACALWLTLRRRHGS